MAEPARKVFTCGGSRFGKIKHAQRHHTQQYERLRKQLYGMHNNTN